MLVDTGGVGVRIEGGLVSTPAAIEMARDVTIVKLRARKIPFRAIGRYLGLDAAAVHRRFHKIPAGARDYYRKQSLGWLDSA